MQQPTMINQMPIASGLGMGIGMGGVPTSESTFAGMSNSGLCSNDWKSIYVPGIPYEMTRYELMQIIQALDMGPVSRIDFAPNKEGSGRMAFIHMTHFNDSPSSNQIRREIEEKGMWELPAYYHTKYPFKIHFMINRRPIPKTDFTVETLVDCMTRMTYALEANSTDVLALKDTHMSMFGNLQGWLISHEQRIQNMEKKMEEANIKSTAQQIRIHELESTVRHQDILLTSVMNMVYMLNNDMCDIKEQFKENQTIPGESVDL